MIQHIDELAELYAVGALDDLERARVEHHVRECAPCTDRVRDAVETVEMIETLQPEYEPPASLKARIKASAGAAKPPLQGARRFAPALAVAAILVAAVIPWPWRFGANMQQDQVALARIAGSATVDRAQFSSVTNEQVRAEVLYNPDAHWYYVVVRSPQPGMQIGCIQNGRTVVLGTVVAHGESGSLYLPNVNPTSELIILEKSAPVADAHVII